MELQNVTLPAKAKQIRNSRPTRVPVDEADWLYTWSRTLAKCIRQWNNISSHLGMVEAEVCLVIHDQQLTCRLFVINCPYAS